MWFHVLRVFDLVMMWVLSGMVFDDVRMSPIAILLRILFRSQQWIRILRAIFNTQMEVLLCVIVASLLTVEGYILSVNTDLRLFQCLCVSIVIVLGSWLVNTSVRYYYRTHQSTVQQENQAAQSCHVPGFERRPLATHGCNGSGDGSHGGSGRRRVRHVSEPALSRSFYYPSHGSLNVIPQDSSQSGKDAAL